MKKVRATWTSGLFAGLVLVFIALSISGCGAVGSSSSTTIGNTSISLTQAPPGTLAANGTAKARARRDRTERRIKGSLFQFWDVYLFQFNGDFSVDFRYRSKAGSG